MPVLWQSSQRPMYVRTVWVDGFRHAILSHDDPYHIQLNAKRHRPHSSASYTINKSHSRNSRLSHHGDDFEDCLRKLNRVLRSDKSNIVKRQRPRSSQNLHIEKLNLTDFEGSDDDFVVKPSPQFLNDSDRSKNDSLNMRNFRSNKTARPEVKDNTDLSDRVLQWLDLAGKVELLATEHAERISQPRHSWPEIQRRNHTLSKSKTAIDIRSREGGRIYSPKSGDSPKAQQSGTIDRHEFYVPTSANTIENYARQSRNVKITPRVETGGKTKDNPNKTKPRDFKVNVVETRQKVVSERSAVEKQYADLVNKKLIPDLSKTPKKQVHIFMPEMPKKSISNATSRTESLLSTNSLKNLKK